MRTAIVAVAALVSSVTLGCGDDDAKGSGGGGGGTTSDATTVSGTSGASGDNTTSTGSGALPAGFECVGSVVLPTTDASGVDVTFSFVDNIALDPVADLTVRFCERTDVGCVSPVLTGVSDADGNLDVTLPFGATGFDGYAIGEGDGFLPTAWIGARPFLPEEGHTYEFQVFRSETLTLAAQAFGIEIDETKATSIVNIADCDGTSAEGAVVEIDVDAERVGYFTDGTPDAARTSTDASGQGFVLNATSGLAHVGAHLEDGGLALGDAVVPLLAGGGTVIYFSPTP